MKRPARTELPERVQYTKYYEHDGMLRAYANRAMVLAMLFAVIAMSSLGFAIYVRIQPPTVVRVDRGRKRHVGRRFFTNGESRSHRPWSLLKPPPRPHRPNSKRRRLSGGFSKTTWPTRQQRSIRILRTLST